MDESRDPATIAVERNCSVMPLPLSAIAKYDAVWSWAIAWINQIRVAFAVIELSTMSHAAAPGEYPAERNDDINSTLGGALDQI